MLRVTVEIVPGGFEPARRVIASLQISNLSDLQPLSDYQVDVAETANHLAGSPARAGSCRVENHDRHQSVWALIERAAAAARTADWGR
ncbi:hypothetical protein ACVIHD_001435 [Bradyrhizobium embrapense]